MITAAREIIIGLVVAISLVGCSTLSRQQAALPAEFTSIFRQPFPPGKDCKWKAGQYSRALTAAGVKHWVVAVEQEDGQLHAKVLTGRTLEDPTNGTVVPNGEGGRGIWWIVPISELCSERWQ
jgi:hypothetical protein